MNTIFKIFCLNLKNKFCFLISKASKSMKKRKFNYFFFFIFSSFQLTSSLLNNQLDLPPTLPGSINISKICESKNMTCVFLEFLKKQEENRTKSKEYYLVGLKIGISVSAFIIFVLLFFGCKKYINFKRSELTFIDHNIKFEIPFKNNINLKFKAPMEKYSSSNIDSIENNEINNSENFDDENLLEKQDLSRNEIEGQLLILNETDLNRINILKKLENYSKNFKNLFHNLDLPFPLEFKEIERLKINENYEIITINLFDLNANNFDSRFLHITKIKTEHELDIFLKEIQIMMDNSDLFLKIDYITYKIKENSNSFLLGIIYNETLPNLETIYPKYENPSEYLDEITLLLSLSNSIKTLQDRNLTHNNLNYRTIFYERKSHRIFFINCKLTNPKFRNFWKTEIINFIDPSFLLNPLQKPDFFKDIWCLGVIIHTFINRENKFLVPWFFEMKNLPERRVWSILQKIILEHVLIFKEQEQNPIVKLDKKITSSKLIFCIYRCLDMESKGRPTIEDVIQTLYEEKFRRGRTKKI